MAVETTPPIDIRQCGKMDYDEALALQRQIVGARAGGVVHDTLLLLTHPPTYTLGLRGGENNFRVSPKVLEAGGAVVRHVDRGGDVTFHGPGQLVGYPIMDVPARCGNIGCYVHKLEQVLIDALEAFDIAGCRIPGYRGVWAEGRKIAAIGVRVNAGGISSHGFALNVNTDLSYFDAIVACGIKGAAVTSMTRLLNRPVSMADVRAELPDVFVRVFG
ncbi:MAG: lipoyl(octanoyl) transferase LipB [Desulfosalsimonadaceae bacterium]